MPGTVRRFSTEHGLKIPQIGWNQLEQRKPSRLLRGLPPSPCVYFVHSYYVDAADKSTVAATVTYGDRADVLVETENIFLTQFHPEKSGRVGLSMLQNFAMGDAL